MTGHEHVFWTVVYLGGLALLWFMIPPDSPA